MARTSAGGVTELQIQNSTHSYAADAGGTDDYAITLNPAVTAYATGQRFAFKANTANTTGATLNVNGLGTKTIVKHFNATLATNDIKAGSIVEVYYDGTNFQMVSMLSQAPAGSGDMQASTYDALGIAGQIAGAAYANSFTKAQTITPDSGVIAITARRNSSGQAAKILEIQSEVNATLASFDKDGNLTAANFSGSSSGTNTGDNATNSQYSSLVSNATHTGDVTGSTALTIANKAVTLAKMDDVATGTVFYRKTALTGAPEVQTLATLKTDLGLTGNNSGDQTSIVGITGTKAQFDTAVSDGNIMYVGDTPTSHVHALSEITDSTSEALGVGTLELGAASDTTIARVSAGVISVEGVTIPTISSTSTLTNKRVNPRTASTTTSATLTPDLSSANIYFRTTQTEALTIGAPTGTPVIGETVMIYVDSAGAQTLTMNATYKVFGAAFPATTTAGKTLMISAQYNGTDWKTLWANAI